MTDTKSASAGVGIEKEDVKDPEKEAQDEAAPILYNISSYGADYDAEGLVKRLERGDIIIPPFQRDYVWNMTEASRLIESLLLGLPVPGIFLAKDTETNKLLVIDGQQRLKSLQFFYDGYFKPKPGDRKNRVFKLQKVQEKFEGMTYNDLEREYRRKLDDSIIHATVIKQESPEEDNTSIYHVFERLNTGGRKLTPQEIRIAVYMGALNDLIADLNDYPKWRELYGPKSSRLKDQESILRFFAVFYDKENYQKPLKEFLNKFNRRNQKLSAEKQQTFRALFTRTIDFIYANGGRAVFRPERAFNTNAAESIMVGVAKILQEVKIDIEDLDLLHVFKKLLENEEYVKTITQATTDKNVLEKRHDLVIHQMKHSL